MVLALTAALVAPYFIDWTSYRAAFEREAGRILGRDVRVEGTARARLLPFPSVTFTDVVVAGAAPGEPAMTVEEFSMDAELAPFLSGELLIFDMRLIRPSMNIEIGEDGRIDWAVRPSTPFDPRQVTLENLTISDGTIRIHQRASGRIVTLDDIDTRVSARSLAGPWRVDGTLTVNGIPVTLASATGTASEEGDMRVRITVQPEHYPFLLETDGQARFEGEAGLYDGTFRLLTIDAAGTGEERTIVEAGNRLSGRFALDHQRLRVDEFRFETGSPEDPYVAEGHALVELGAEPSFLIEADGAQIRLDAVEGEGGIMSGLSADERLQALTRFIAGLPKPSIPGTIAVDLPAIVAGDTTVRDIHLRARPVAEGWNIESLAATLPGRTRFEGDGLLATGEGLSFEGHMLLAVKQPSGFAAWLARDVDEAIRRLPAAGFSADVTLTDERQRFQNLELILGDARFTGAIDRQSPAGARPSLLLELNGSKLDVEGMRAFASLFVDDAGRNRLADHDVNLEIVAGPVSVEGLTAERVDTALRLREGRLEIDRLTLTGLADANISATGNLAGLGGEPTGQVDATVVAVDLAPLVELLAQRFPGNRLLTTLNRHASQYPGLLADSEIDIIASAAADGEGTPGLSVSARGLTGGTGFSLSLSSSEMPVEEGQVSIQLAARNQEAATLYALAGLPALPLGLAGAVDVEFSATGTPAEGLESMFRVRGQGLQASFTGTIKPGSEGFAAVGQAQIEAEDLEPWLAAAGVSLPGFGYGLPVELSAALDYREGVLSMRGLAGQVAGSDVSGDLKGFLRDGLPHLTGSLALGGLDFRPGIEMVLGPAAFEAGGGPWPQAPFRQDVTAPFSANVELSAGKVWIGNAATAEDARFHVRLGPEGMAISDLSAHYLGGVLEGLAELRNDAGTGLLAAQFSLNGVPLERLLPGGGLSGLADVSASVTSAGKSVDAMTAALSGSGSAALENLVISGFDRRALAPIIAEADKLGVEIDAESVAAFAPALVRRGSYPAGDIKFAFTLADGVARMAPVHLESDGARMSVEAAANLKERTVSASGSITYDAGAESVSGSEPMIRFSLRGPLGESRPVLDTDPLTRFLTQRALELEQARVEHMQAVLLERQRLRREMRYFTARAAEREAAEAARRAQEAERVRLEREAERARRAAEERERQEREAEEARRRAEEAAPARPEEQPTPGAVGPIQVPPLEAPDPDGSEIERRALPPPEPRGAEQPVPDPAAQNIGEDDSFLDIEDLTVERLLHLLKPPAVQ